MFRVLPLLLNLCFYQAMGQVKKVEELAKNYNGYFTNFLNTNLFNQDNLVYKVALEGRDIKIVLNDYSNSSAVITNRILNGDIKDEKFIEDYLDYVSLKFVVGIRDSMKSNQSIKVSFITSAPKNASVVSDVCLLYQSLPDSISKRDIIFFDAIRSAYQQLQANKFNEAARLETEREYSWSVKPEDKGLTFNNLKSLVDYFDSTKQRVLPWFGKHQKDVAIAFENLARRFKSDQDELYFLMAEQYHKLQEYKKEYPNSFFIMEVTNPNLSKSSLKNVDDYQIETLVQLMNKKDKNDMASVWQTSLLKRMDYGSSRNLNRAMYILTKSEFLDSAAKSKYFDYVDEEYVSNDEIKANNFYSRYNFLFEGKNSEGRNGDKSEPPKINSDRFTMAAGAFLDLGSEKNELNPKGGTDQRAGVKMSFEHLSNNNWTYLSFANGTSERDASVRYVEFGTGRYFSADENRPVVPSLSIKFPLRYTSITESRTVGVNPKALFASASDTIFSTNGLNLGIGGELNYKINNLVTIGIEGLYMTNSIYKPKWKRDDKELPNLNNFNFRGFSFSLKLGLNLGDL